MASPTPLHSHQMTAATALDSPTRHQKSEKMTSNSGHPFKRGKSSKKPHLADVPQRPELGHGPILQSVTIKGHGPILQSVTIKGTRATAAKVVRSHDWVRSKGPDS